MHRAQHRFKVDPEKLGARTCFCSSIPFERSSRKMRQAPIWITFPADMDLCRHPSKTKIIEYNCRILFSKEDRAHKARTCFCSSIPLERSSRKMRQAPCPKRFLTTDSSWRSRISRTMRPMSELGGSRINRIFELSTNKWYSKASQSQERFTEAKLLRSCSHVRKGGQGGYGTFEQWENQEIQKE
jgi:hypothetical protein